MNDRDDARDRGSFDPPLDTERWPPSGRLLLHLRKALARGDGEHDLVLELRRRDGRWDRECTGEAPSFNGELHEFDVARGGDGLRWEFRGPIKPDAWVVVGGHLSVAVELDADAPAHGAGAYRGDFAGAAISGAVEVEFVERPRPSRGVRADAPRLLAEPVDRLWDFSRAGWRSGTEPGPPAELPVVDAVDHGVEPDSGRECAPALQAAVDAAAAAGGGVVLLPPGVLDYRVDDWQPPILVSHPHVHLRGAGSGPDGTLLVNHRYADYAAAPGQPWKAGRWPVFAFRGRGPRSPDGQMGTDDPAAEAGGSGRTAAVVRAATRGSPVLTVECGHGLLPGRPYLLVHEEAAGGPLAEALLGGACTPAASYREPGAQLVRQLVEVVAVDGDRVELDGPVHWTLRTDWPARLLEVELLRDVSISGMRLRGHWDGFFTHHKNPEHDNGWDQIGWQWCADGFVADMVHENCTTGVGMGNCRRCTVADVRVTGNPGHNGICLGGASTACLLLRCDLERPMHAINLSGAPCGNVIHDCRISEPGGLDLHGGTGLDNLVDRLTGGVLVGGGSRAHVPPRHGPGLVLWNWAQGHRHPYKPWRRVARLATWRETPGFVAVGVHAMDGHHLRYEGPDGPATADRRDDRAWVESLNQAVSPPSLYRWQRR